jgi:hypothetical protein
MELGAADLSEDKRSTRRLPLLRRRVRFSVAALLSFPFPCSSLQCSSSYGLFASASVNVLKPSCCRH